MNIVLVEDSPPIRRLVLRHLAAVPGTRVVGEASGETEAIALIRRERPDVVLLDLSLSPGNGMNVLRQIRADGLRSKVLVLTNQPLDAYRQQCEALGADGFHDKSTDLYVVMSLLRQWVADKAAATVDLIQGGSQQMSPGTSD
jgi:DNA-binding NarL/FixJ family response regulator